MKLFLISSLLIISYFVLVANSGPLIKQENVKLYLQKFGYFDNSTRYNSNAILGKDEISSALKEFQRFAGLKQTGEGDDDTLVILVNLLRFGVDEKIRLSESANIIRGSNEKQGASDRKKCEEQCVKKCLDVPNICEDANIDTVVVTQSRQTYFFKGDWYWEVMSDSNRIVDGYPRKIADDWDGLESNLDAAFTSVWGRTFIFKGSRYWAFSNKKMDEGYPKPISSGFPGAPNMMDTAFFGRGVNRIYFFKGNKYWRYNLMRKNGKMDPEFPRTITTKWGLPANINAGLLGADNFTYFFKGDKYYQYDDAKEQIQEITPPYPRSTARWWFGCHHITDD